MSFHGYLVKYSDVLSYLQSDTQVSSTFGVALDKVRDGTTGINNLAKSVKGMEENLLKNASVVRCIDLLSAKSNIFSVNATMCNTVRKLAQSCGYNEGAMVVAIMKTFQPFSSSHPEKGLVKVYKFVSRIDPEFHKPFNVDDEDVIIQGFREGKYKVQKNEASKLVSDSQIALSSWVEIFNRKIVRETKNENGNEGHNRRA